MNEPTVDLPTTQQAQQIDPYAPTEGVQDIFRVLAEVLHRTDSPLVDAGKALAASLKSDIASRTATGVAALAFLAALRDIEDQALSTVAAQTRLTIHTLATTVATLAQDA